MFLFLDFPLYPGPFCKPRFHSGWRDVIDPWFRVSFFAVVLLFSFVWMGRRNFLPGVGWGRLVGVESCNLFDLCDFEGEAGKGMQRMGKSGG